MPIIAPEPVSLPALWAGPVTMVSTLRPKGDDLAAWFDFDSAGYQIGGTAKKKI